MSSLRTRLATMATMSVLLAATLAAAPVAAASNDRHHDRDLTCRAGAIAPGTYNSIVVAGDCAIPTGLVTVRGNVVLLARSSLWTEQGIAQLQVRGNLLVGHGAVLSLGCNITECLAPGVLSVSKAAAVTAAPTASTFERSALVGGDIRADDAAAVFAVFATVAGDIKIDDGGVGPRACAAGGVVKTRGGLQIESVLVLFYTIADGSVRVTHTRACLLFVAFTMVGVDLVETGNWAVGNGNALVGNLIGRDLLCRRNTPAPIAQMNTVGRHSVGQCAIGG